MVTIKECCAICENLYDADKCPLFKTYNCAAEYCVDDFDKVAKYHVCCEKFETMGEYKAAIEIAEKRNT